MYYWGNKAGWPVHILTLIGVWDAVSVRKGSGSFIGKNGKEGFFRRYWCTHCCSSRHAAPLALHMISLHSLLASRGVVQGGTLTCLVLPPARQRWGAAAHDEPKGR